MILSMEETLITIYVEVDDWYRGRGAGQIPVHPGPKPAFSDPEVLTLALAWEVLARRSERAFWREVATDWHHLFPDLPHRSELHRRTKWLWGALEALRVHFTGRLGPPAAGWEQLDTTPLPVKHPSWVRRPDWWVGPPGSDLTAGFGLCPAKGKHAWFYGFRLALRTGLLDQVPRGWSIVPAAVDERAVGEDLVSEVPVAHLLTDRGFRSRDWQEVLKERGTTLLTTPDRKQRRQWPEGPRRFVAAHRNRIENGIELLKERFNLERHGAKSFWGLLTRVCGKLAAYALYRFWRLSNPVMQVAA
jgi:Transposase DDE domain